MTRAIKVLALMTMFVTLTAGCRSMTGQSLGTIVDDQTTHGTIKAKLAAEKVRHLTWVGVDVENGIVSLTGNVESEIQKQRAENIARSTPGVRGVVNALLVTPGGVEHAQEVRPPGQASMHPSAQPDTAQQAVTQQERTVQQYGTQQQREQQQQDAQQPTEQARAETQPAASPAAQQVLSRQTMTGEVRDVNLGTGQVRLTTPEGRMDLAVPQDAARSLRAGDRVTIEMVIRSGR